MLHIAEIQDPETVYACQMGMTAPFVYRVDFETWKKSYANDCDGAGRRLFRTLCGKAAYDGDTLVGFLQYGRSALGFDQQGEISTELSYPVIRYLYFDKGREDAGALLLREAMKEFAAEKRIYAFFHYFGMSCFARHGKLFERYDWIQDFLGKNGFAIEHENVYYSVRVTNGAQNDVKILADETTMGNQQTLQFLLRNTPMGECELHFPENTGICYLRWIYVREEMQNRGIGSKCMDALKQWLWAQGVTRLDTDTARNNLAAQHYYEKNGFTRKGITRSFFRDR